MSDFQFVIKNKQHQRFEFIGAAWKLGLVFLEISFYLLLCYCSGKGGFDKEMDWKFETNSQLYSLAFFSSKRNPLEDKS